MSLPDIDSMASQPVTTEARKYPRFPVSLPVSFGDGLFVRSGTVVDISREGCRIRYADAPPEEQYFRAEIRLDNVPEILTVDLAVRRWARTGEFGVEFIRMTPQDQARLRRLIRLSEDMQAGKDPSHQLTLPLVGREDGTEEPS